MNKNPQYNFTPEIKDELKGFKTYLQELGNGENTIRQKMNYTGYFMKWLETENLHPEETSYNDLLNFIDYCRLEEKSIRQINSTLRSIKNYFEYLKTNNPELINPASNLQLKGKVNKLPSNIINYAKVAPLALEFSDVTLMTKGALTNKGYGIENTFYLNWEMGTQNGNMNPTRMLDQMIPADTYTLNIILTLSVY